jgi:DHA1 family multidrug resistance protein-like MFS transporter
MVSVLLLIPMSFVQTPLQLAILRFLLGAADGALLPAVQTLLVYNSTSQVAGRIFSYNQSFRDIGNVTGPLIGASVSASYGFRAVFLSPRRSSCSTLSIPPSACGALPVMNPRRTRTRAVVR